MGLVADDEFGDEFIRQTASKDKVSANLHEDFEAGQLDGDCQKKTAFLA